LVGRDSEGDSCLFAPLDHGLAVKPLSTRNFGVIAGGTRLKVSCKNHMAYGPLQIAHFTDVELAQ
jgi:hypothetical protein